MGRHNAYAHAARLDSTATSRERSEDVRTLARLIVELYVRTHSSKKRKDRE